MELKRIDKDNVTVLQLDGKMMGGPDATELHESLHALLEADIKNVIIDLDAVELINSSGLGILISSMTTVKNNGGKLCLARPGKKIQNIFNITKLSSVFTTFDDIEEAVASFE